MKHKIKVILITAMSISILTLSIIAAQKASYKQGYADCNASVVPVKQEPRVVEKIVYKNPKGVIANITMADLDADLKRVYSHISSDQRKTLLLAIAKAADKYSINPVILFGVCDVETNFRPWKTHAQVLLPDKHGKKTIKDNAIGIGGILPYYWVKKLKAAGIIETKSDLYDASKNIMAIAFVLDTYKKEPMLKGTSDKTTSALRKYFGLRKQPVYSDKIRAVVGRILFAKVYD